MVRRTTILLDEDIYGKLFELSIKKYGGVRGLSRVVKSF